MNPSHHLPTTAFKNRFTRRFLRALAKIVQQNAPSPSSSLEALRRHRYRKVRTAADESMALAAGPRRAWSRALLWKLRSQRRRRWRRWTHRHAMMMRRTRKGPSNNATMVGREINRDKSTGSGNFAAAGVEEQEEGELRRVVPGGEAMDLCRLLEETGDYIKCLTAKIQVMATIANLISAA